MSQSKGDENFYELLKVSTKASMSEIVTAYNTAKAAFSHDSMATYSLFSEEETQEILDRLEEAYLTLSNIDRKRDYDKKLAGGQHLPNRPTRNPNSAPMARDEENTSSEIEMTLANAARNTTPAAPEAPVEAPALLDGVINGPFLRSLREKRGLSVDDVARVTKIPGRALKAIEADDFPHLPARVYLQGFVKNMASLYKAEPAATAKAYLEFLSKHGI